MGAKQAIHVLLPKQGQMDIRREGRVTHQDVSRAEFRMQQADLRHVVRPQRRCQLLDQQTALGVEHRQPMSHGRTTARPLTSRLAEMGLQLGRVRHRKARAVHQERSMTEPQRKRRGASRGAAGLLEQPLVHRQRQSGPCLTIGLAQATQSRQPHRMGASGIAGQHLNDEGVDGFHGTEFPPPPTMPNRAAGFLDGLGR
ncbi:MAG: hypothetical protein DCC68_23365 [Planctomycetota bacterium]|nr:MAG: hypothetical protein DCC68_23365 [Planctomycetota bacterium]